MGHGLIHVYTGNGKGKTTAALGQAMRAAGRGWRVLIIQFMKGDPSCGELHSCAQIKGIRIIQSGPPFFGNKGQPTDEEIRLAEQGMDTAREAIRSSEADMVILDEINVAIDHGLVPLDQVLDLVRSKPKTMDLVFTGRNAAQALIDAADLATEMREIKHPFQKGLTRLEGIDC